MWPGMYLCDISVFITCVCVRSCVCIWQSDTRSVSESVGFYRVSVSRHRVYGRGAHLCGVSLQAL